MKLNELPALMYGKSAENLSCSKKQWTLPNEFDKEIFVDAAYTLGNTYPYVVYQEGKIGIMQIEAHELVISDNFNGCWMAKFRLNGNLYACHIAMDDRAKQLDYFLSFIQTHNADVLALFKPVALATMQYSEVFNSCIGMITRDNRKVYINVEKETYHAYLPREVLSDNKPVEQQKDVWREQEYGEIALSSDLLII